MNSDYLVKLNVRLMSDGNIAIGPGKAQLLKVIRETGSISAAARHMKMSYRRAWMLVDTMNNCFKAPLVRTETGGKRGGGTRLSKEGEQVLAIYEDMMKELDSVAKKHVRKLVKQSPLAS